MTADALVSRHTAAWRAATVHPFLAGVRDGSVPENCFDRWLAQDYLYAQALVRAQSRIAGAAPFACKVSAKSWESPTSTSQQDCGRTTAAPTNCSMPSPRFWRGVTSPV
jgi:thiaminase